MAGRDERTGALIEPRNNRARRGLAVTIIRRLQSLTQWWVRPTKPHTQTFGHSRRRHDPTDEGPVRVRRCAPPGRACRGHTRSEADPVKTAQYQSLASAGRVRQTVIRRTSPKRPPARLESGDRTAPDNVQKTPPTNPKNNSAPLPPKDTAGPTPLITHPPAPPTYPTTG